MNRKLHLLFSFAILALWTAGCATGNVNPPTARPNTGYVDFHTAPSGDFYWQVARLDERTQGFKKIFSDFRPPAGGGLRLALVPGRYRLQVTFLNLAVREPCVVEVEIKDGWVTPVQVALVGDGTSLVQRKEQRVGASAKGGYRLKTSYSSEESAIYQLSAKTSAPVPYQTKEHLW